MNNQKREIVEETPEYRSVMIAPMAAPPMPRSFASMRPAKAAPAQPQTKSNSTISETIWQVTELPSLPAAYFLERSSVYVDCSAQEAANRICDCLRLESIASTCDSEDKNLLIGETCDCIKFAVRLFADKGSVVVEIQRKCGCSYQFRETARSVLRSAKGAQTVRPKRKFTIPSSIPQESEEQKQKRAEDGVKIALMQLDSDRTDSQLIGMESLEQLTRCESRAVTSKSILREECLNKVLAAVVSDFSEPRSDMEERQVSVMKRRALAVLANALCALAESNDLEETLRSTPELKSESLIISLIDTLRESTTYPHDASQAARCVQKLMTAPDVKELLMQSCAIEVVATACVSGACRSVLLERESKKLRQQMSNCI